MNTTRNFQSAAMNEHKTTGTYQISWRDSDGLHDLTVSAKSYKDAKRVARAQLGRKQMPSGCVTSLLGENGEVQW